MWRPPPGVGAPQSASAFGAPSQLGGASAFGTCAFQRYTIPRPGPTQRVSLFFSRRWHWCFRRCSRRWCFRRRSRWWWWVCELRSSSCQQWIWGFGAGRRLCTCAVVWRTPLRQSQRTRGRLYRSDVLRLTTSASTALAVRGGWCGGSSQLNYVCCRDGGIARVSTHLKVYRCSGKRKRLRRVWGFL